MNALLLTFASLYGLFFVVWTFYLAGMHLKKRRDQLNWFAKGNAYVLLVFAVILDFIFNMTAGTILFFERPRPIKEPLFTARLKRHKAESRGWKKKVAFWFCEHLLNQFDEGHC